MTGTWWPWLVLAGLGAFHGLNPAMGWLFAVALGMHRRSRRVVLLALVPLTLGHALSVAMVAAVVLALGATFDMQLVRRATGALLLAWAAYHSLYGARHRVRFGLTVGMLGLGVWSFLMATAHGAGLMVVPALMPLTDHAAGGHAHVGAESVPVAVAAVAVHTAAMMAVTGIVALLVYQWLGVDFLRRGWVNLDYLWSLALAAIGAWLLFL
ncbi:hypothetical protein [Thiohalorhabdus methylotrophus]|uniref:Arginine/ornithine antiporter ArcD n=1 Tax=Thiohalorhabdus methylotrophus TaxID=3242694 RepID=A0ABV4TWC3_9GAMM